MFGFRPSARNVPARRPSSATPQERLRKACMEALEERRLFTTAYALIGDAGTTLVKFDTDAPATIQDAVSVSGLLGGERLAGIDFRPADGKLYALGIVDDAGPNSSGRLYTVNTDTGAATLVGPGAFSNALLDDQAYGFDFNPAADRLRITNGGDQNLRVNPNTGALVAFDTPISDGDGATAETLTAVAYDRNDEDPATATTLYAIDFNGDNLAVIGSPNGTPNSPNGGAVTEVGPTGVTSSTTDVQFDIAPDGTAFATMRAASDGLTALYTINLATGAATRVGTVGNGADDLKGFAVNVDAVANAPDVTNDSFTTPINTPLVIAAPGVLGNDTDPNGDNITAVQFTQPANGTVVGNPDGSFTYTPNSFFNGTDTFTYRASDGTNTSPAATVTVTVTPSNLMAFGLVGSSTLIKFLTNAPGTIVDTVPVQGLQQGERLLGIDFRPANASLYGVGSSGRIYRINVNTGATTSVQLTADATDASDPFTALSGDSFGVDFNPVPDRLRVTSNTGQNLRINVDTGATITDGTVNPAGPEIAGSGYLNPDVDPATGTTLFTIDRAGNTLNTQNPPNNGTQVPVGAGLGVDVTGDIGFDVARDGRGFLAATDAATDLTRFYTVNLTTGAASVLGNIGNGAQSLNGLAVQLEGVAAPAAPTLAINDVAQNEGNSGQTQFVFTVTRTGDLTGTSTVNFATQFGNNVTSAADLPAQSGQVTFNPGQATAQITILVNGDTQIEQDNLFFVNLSGATGATIGDAQGRGDILNDDAPTPSPTPAPTLTINNVSKAEGNSGQTPFVFTVTRTGNTSAATTVNFATAFGNSVTSVQDLPAQSGQVTFGVGETTKQITILVNGDTQKEQNNLFFVNLTNPVNGAFGDSQGRGDILNDD